MNRNEELLNKVIVFDKSSDVIVDTLKKYGICILPNYISDEVSDLVREDCLLRSEVDEDIDFKDGSYRRYDGPKTMSTPDKRVYHIDCFNEDMAKFKNDDFLKSICKKYYNNKSDYSVHVQIYERHNVPNISIRGFHIDTFETSTFKSMLYLSDVTEIDGPTSYIIKTHLDFELRRKKKEEWGPGYKFEDSEDESKHPTNFNKSELGEERLNNWVKVIAKKGTVILFDTWGVHRGIKVLNGGDRHMVVNYYRPGKDLERSDFGYDDYADYKKYFNKNI
jgi:hypothetical protein